MNYKLFMVISLAVLGIAWFIYWLYNMYMDRQEKLMPKKQVVEKAKEMKDSLSDYAQQLAKFEKKTYQRDDSDNPFAPKKPVSNPDNKPKS